MAAPRGPANPDRGGAGCGKTLLSMECPPSAGATEYDEPGVFVAFEEKRAGAHGKRGFVLHRLKKLIASKKLMLVTSS